MYVISNALFFVLTQHYSLSCDSAPAGITTSDLALTCLYVILPKHAVKLCVNSSW